MPTLLKHLLCAPYHTELWKHKADRAADIVPHRE